MSTQPQVLARPAARSANPTLVLIAGWLIPGAGHFMVRKPIRGALLFLSIFGMFATGIALQGKIYVPQFTDVFGVFGQGSKVDLLDVLGFLAQLGSGLLDIVTRFLDLGHTAVVTAVADYGTKFIVVAGLLNIVAAVDAHSLANGRKAS